MSIPHRVLLPPVTTPGDLTTRWALVVREGDLTVRDQPRNDLLVQLFDAEGHQQSALVVVEDVPDRPEGPFLRNLAAMLHEVLAEQTAGIGAAAFALSPPGPRDVGAADLEWAQGLVEACAAEALRVLGVHLVTDGGVHPLR
ncbi:hypothetical protein [Kineococcus rhizosphaerae]|uniref:Uncharacterized protein n=1 Tax=Kineococcus rhizosphaerae TaxID=559628 RepID=A0A2T0QZP0_9ACTN|nr:hypothetical protein [Kineococcus rhizosphaerae]PRY12159.1 hypothetical protein CLV37_111116 [Kineococcus rhizosphaerae]